MVLERKSHYSDAIPAQTSKPQVQSDLEEYITITRQETSKIFRTLSDKFNFGFDSLIGYEQEKVKLITQYKDKNERFLPGLLYCMIGGFGTFILLKNKGILLYGGLMTSQIVGFGLNFPKTTMNILQQKRVQ